MSTSDAIIVGEGWISEHFFTTEATSQSFLAKVLDRRRTWEAEAKEKRPTPRSRFTEARQKLELDLAGLAEIAEPEILAKAALDVYDQVLDVLELRGHGLHVAESGPVLRISAPGITEKAPLAVVLGSPVATVEEAIAKNGTTLFAPHALVEEGEELTSAARLVSALFVDEDAPEFVLLLAGRWALLAEQSRWAEGQYLAVDLQLVCERNDGRRGGEIDRALTCLSAQSIAPGADGALWWHGVLEESVKHTVGVSKDLREGVRLSIEIIANEVVARRRDQGLDALPADDANELAKQSLRFLYRILFLLYAEASPELGVLPVGAQTYDAGYSLDRLRDLVQVELSTPQARSGTHLYSSLGVLFRLVDKGHSPARAGPEADEGLQFNALRADLFDAKATRFIDAVGLGNVALQTVLGHLLLSKEKRGKDRGFISYAELGINQLGAVYEGLMSYTGFFAETDLYEVAKGGDAEKGSWVVPVSRAKGIATSDFVKAEDPVTGEKKPVVHEQGSFVFRLSGRDRQQSASYYTPEVLTKFTVGQALEELLDQDGTTTPAADILTFSVCEPALGSGAFAIEAVRQLAEQYLQRRQDELGERIDPDDYPRRLQEVKAYLALHNVYGVDLNATAVELAEISLWLDTMVSGLDAPWFGLHLRRGNSLIGARRAVYKRSQVADKSWLSAVPRDLPLTSFPDDIAAERVGSDLGDGIHHFLLPADGWGAAADAKEAAGLVPDAVKGLKRWRGSTKTKPSKTQVAALAELADRVETLWQISYRRLQIAEQEIRRSIPVWGTEGLPVGGAVQREQIEASLADEASAYRRLRRVMDAWTALWFWPLTETATTVDGKHVAPPTVDQWIAGLRALLGRNPELTGKSKPKTKRDAGPGQISFAAATRWDELGDAEALDLEFAGARPIEVIRAEHPWLVVCERLALQQGFFHWNLDFSTVFARGGFDLQLGNPPWVRPIADADSLLAEGDPWWTLSPKPSEEEVAERRNQTLSIPGLSNFVVDSSAHTSATSEFVGSRIEYAQMEGLQPDLYRCFMKQTWRHASPQGRVGLIHPESHFTDEKAGPLRRETYSRLRRHWQFINQLLLFEIDNKDDYGVHIYGSPSESTKFQMAAYLYHPDVIQRSLEHDGSGAEPGMKDENDRWNLKPHRGRITIITDETLITWRNTLERPGVPPTHARMVYSVNRTVEAASAKLSSSRRIGDLRVRISTGWHEKTDRTKGRFATKWGLAESWDDVILQGPHMFVGTPLYKNPNPSLRSNKDWSATDFEALAVDAIPATAYQPAGDRYEYDCAYTDWGDLDTPDPARDYYRVAWRNMAKNGNERTLIPAIFPPGAAHVHTVYSAACDEDDTDSLAEIAGVMSLSQ